MPLLSLPREMRNAIIDAVLQSHKPLPQKDDTPDDGSLAPPYELYHALGLVLTCHQLQDEVSERLRLLSPPSVVDVTVTKENDFLVDWTSIPLRGNQPVEVNFHFDLLGITQGQAREKLALWDDLILNWDIEHRFPSALALVHRIQNVYKARPPLPHLGCQQLYFMMHGDTPNLALRRAWENDPEILRLRRIAPMTLDPNRPSRYGSAASASDHIFQFTITRDPSFFKPRIGFWQSGDVARFLMRGEVACQVRFENDRAVYSLLDDPFGLQRSKNRTKSLEVKFEPLP